MLSDEATCDENSNNVVLIDYGYASRYITKDGKLIKQHEVDSFRGNILFASVDQLEFQSASRKRDLISICYFIIFVLNGLEMPLCKDDSKIDDIR